MVTVRQKRPNIEEKRRPAVEETRGQQKPRYATRSLNPELHDTTLNRVFSLLAA